MSKDTKILQGQKKGANRHIPVSRESSGQKGIFEPMTLKRMPKNQHILIDGMIKYGLL